VIGTQEILIVAGVVVLLFGGRKIPEMMRGMGEGVREFKKATEQPQEEGKDSAAPAENK